MSFDKNYPNRKDHREPFQSKAELCDRTCRPGGSCKWCVGNRTFNKLKAEYVANEDLKPELSKDHDPE